MVRIVFLLVFVAGIGGDEDSSLEVTVKQGTLRGHLLTSRKGRDIFAFQRIPYAKPPIGDLRFRCPQPPEPWDGILDATLTAPMCIQRNIFTFQKDVSGDEDCLYLNVYTPQRSGKLDVMVYIHGGGWLAGTGSYVGPKLLLDRDVVLVTINFRLGPIGFLSTGDAVCPGNNGLKDQVAALRWVRDNIEAFGGNPNSVTIFGESAGGASVHYHVLSPASRGLFHRAISESGTALGLWAIAPNGSSVHQTKKVASLLDCPTKPNRALMSCLRRRNVEDIIKTDTSFMEWNIDPTLTFKPVLESEVGNGDEVFLPAHPLELIQNASNVPWMTGITSADGGFVASRVYGKNLIEDMNKRFEFVGPLIMHYDEIPKSTQDEVSKKIREFYFKNGSMNRDTIPEVVNMFTDSWFFSGADQSVKLHLDQDTAPVYYYYFDYRGTDSYSTLYGDSKTNYGVSHSDELLYVLYDDVAFPNRTLSENDEKMTDIMTSIWANFANNGNPTPDNNEFGAWPQVSSADAVEYGHIKLEGVHIERGLLVERAKFWSNLPVRAKIPTPHKDEL